MQLYFLALIGIFLSQSSLVPKSTKASEPSETSGKPSVDGEYGERIRYRKGVIIVYPEFRVEFIERRPQAGPGPMGDVFEFRVESRQGARAVIWSSGAGDIGPAVFSIGGQCFRLEMLRADGIEGRLDEDEIVVRPAPRNWCRQNDGPGQEPGSSQLKP